MNIVYCLVLIWAVCILTSWVSSTLIIGLKLGYEYLCPPKYNKIRFSRLSEVEQEIITGRKAERVEDKMFNRFSRNVGLSSSAVIVGLITCVFVPIVGSTIVVSGFVGLLYNIQIRVW